MYGFIKYKNQLQNGINIDALAYYDDYQLEKHQVSFFQPNVIKEILDETLNTKMYGFNVDMSFNINQHTMVMGLATQTDQSAEFKNTIQFPVFKETNNLALDEITRETYGIFIQDIYNINDQLALTTGVRYDSLSDFENEFTYRMGLTWQWRQVYGKLLTGSAYRVPSYREYLDIKAFNFELTPEHLQTTELLLGWKRNNLDVNFTLYYNNYKNFIKELFVDTIQEGSVIRIVDDEYAINAQKREILGAELNFTYIPIKKIQLSVNLSNIIKAKETLGQFNAHINTASPVNSDETEINFLSKTTLSLNAHYQYSTAWALGSRFLYYSRRNTPPNYHHKVPLAVKFNDNSGIITKTDLFVEWQPVQQITLNVSIDNLFNEAQFSPSIDNPEQYDAEWPDRAITGKLSYQF